MHRLVVVPRWSGRPGSDFYPWLVEQLAVRREFSEIVVCDLPEPGTPRLDTWPPAIREVLGADGEQLARTVVLGHSVGCQAVLHALAQLPVGTRIAGMLAVAGWWTVDKPWPTILPWQAGVADLGRVRAAVARLVVLLSDNDPFTANYADNAALWRERLGAEVVVAPGARHFNDAQEPAVLDALMTLVGEV